MTKEEAIQEMQKGKAVSHQLFTPDEYLIMKDKMMFDEAGYELDQNYFWEIRPEPYWQEGWLIVEV